MKRIHFLCLLALAAVASCGPASYTMEVETRSPSVSGLDLRNKTFSVSFVDKRGDYGIASSLAEGFAEALEKDYFGGEQTIGVYSIADEKGVKYSCKDSLIQIVLGAESDVAFLLELDNFGDLAIGDLVETGLSSKDSLYMVKGTIPYKVGIYAYDSMNPADTVVSYTGSTNAWSFIYTSGRENRAEMSEKLLSDFSYSAQKAGESCARFFLSGWDSANYRFYYYDSTEWQQAAQAVDEYKWQDAIGIWMNLLDTGNIEKRACLEYNIATACLLLGQKSLAAEWLDRSDKDMKRPSSDWLRKKIEK